jgi:hypothetical protein
MSGQVSSEALRVRYLDWCSAKVAEYFLRLSPEEVWLRAAAARETPDPAAEAGMERGFVFGGPSFGLARRMARQLAAELDLPSYEVWVEEYLRDPERFEQEILAAGLSVAASEQGDRHPH